MQVFVGDEICANVSGNSSTLQCLVPHLPAGDYQVKGYDPTRGWASSNVTYTSHLSVSSVLNNYGCLGQGLLHLQGTGFSPGNTSVTVCGAHCEVQDSLTTPTDVHCVAQLPSDSLGFLCSFSEDVTGSCKGPQNTYIQCDVTVVVGTFSLTKEGAYVHVCHGLPCTTSFKLILDAPSFITGLFFSPKVERDEVLIYNSSCTITMATEAEMECEAPNQPITTKITEIRKNWGQNTKVNISLNFCGRWSENSSWSCEHLPQDGDNVTVERGQTLLLDTTTKVLNLLHVKGGKLLFLGPGPITLHAHYILVSDGGELRIGSHDEPFTGKAQIHLYGSGYSGSFFPYGVKFFAVRNATLSIHGWQPGTPFTHLKSPARANSSRIELEKVVDWRPGDEIVISGRDSEDDSRQDEVVTIETVNGAEVVFRPPLRYHHSFIEQMVNGEHLVLRPLVAVLTRDIVLRGNLTRERISYVQQCAALGFTDVSKCIYGKSERRLGSRDLGAVVVAQTFQDEPSVIRLEGLQMQNVGQAFRPPRAALTVAGNGHMTDSYIRGCSILHSFGRGLSLSSTSSLKVENNLFYNISGHGLLLEEGMEHGNRIWRNAVIGIFPTVALSNIEILSPAGILIRSPTNTVEENIVWDAGIGFFFHLSPEGPSQASLQSFSSNTATYCTRSALEVYPEYCPKSTRETAMAVFQSFTAWRSRGGVEIHRSSNLQLQHFQIFSCTDFGIDITESLGNTSLVDSLLLGRFTGKSDSCMVAGLKTPKIFQLLVSNTTFVNFDQHSCTAINTCSDCYQGQGGFRVEVVQLKFINSPNRALFPFPHSAILDDVDGSVSGKEGSHLLASMDTLPASCRKYAINGTSIGSVCGKDVILHRMSIGLIMAPDKEYYLLMTDSSNKTTTANYVHDTLSNLFGWMALLVDGETYTLAFDDSSTRRHLQYSATFDNFAAGNYLLVEHGDLPSNVDVMITCGGRPGQSLQFPPSPSINKGCDWFFDRKIRKLTYLVSGESDIRVEFKADERVPLPPTGPSLSSNIVLKWSLPESWQGVEPGWAGSNYSVPSAGDDVIILPNRTIFVDIDLPPLRGLYIFGTLKFPVNSSNVLSAACIVVAGGELIIGTSEHPLEREHKVSIILRASEGIFCHRLKGINVDPGTIGVFGKLQIHSAHPKMTWTQLGADIAPGNDRILLEDAVDWIPGEDIVISSSTYDAHQAELGTVTEVYKNSIKIHKQLLHRHTGRSYMVENRNLSSAAEVGLLTRNVKIESDEPCSGRIHVGQLKSINGTYFTGVLQLSHVEITNFGTMQHSSIEINGAAPGSYMMFSSIHHSCSGGISAVASSNISLNGNVVFNTTGHGINLEGQNHKLSRNLIVLTKQPENVKEWIASIKVNLADDITLLGNTVAGSERVAFRVSGQICDEFQNPWKENVAHSSLHGVHLYDGDGFQNCTRIAGFTAYKNYDYGIMFHVGSSVVVENLTLIDNNIGLLPIVHGQKDQNKFEKKYILLRQCVIVATSPAFDCLKDRIRPYNVDLTSRDRSPLNPLRGRVGIIWPIFTSKAGQWPKDSWHRIISNSSVHGITKFQDVTFSGFVKSCYSDENDVCIMTNPGSAQVMYPIIAERTTMSQIKDVNRFFFHPSQSWPGDMCADACDRRRALYKEVDGSTLAPASSVTVSPVSEHEWTDFCFDTSKLTTVSITDAFDSLDSP
ncbi:hypothetical protein NDU88_001796 [Pleurodeles waltl]|uniref:G8 domain-containing protein n=3 Tax=Pleurodeles waltl TaxID=8319 RepID=A0AAV7R9L4_PLEWA|nr:hypothetical protein NDU88_001796 [Pleurodeles waltl]